MAINNIKVDVLPVSECAKFLGQTTKFQQQETTEIRSRIRAAWGSFHKYNQELTSKSYLLQHRVRLFNMVISPTLSYASGTLTLTKELGRMIRSTQREMLRFNCTNEKEVQEEDTELQRGNRIREAQIPCWIETHRRTKWRKAMRMASLPRERWVRKAAEWNPGRSTKIKTCRAVGR